MTDTTSVSLNRHDYWQPRVSALNIIGPDPGDLSLNENLSLDDAADEIRRCTDSTWVTVAFSVRPDDACRILAALGASDE